MSQKSPLARVKEEFGGKDKLVDKIVGIVGAGADESKDDLRKRLLGAANSKLIRIHTVATAAKTEYGGRDGLVSVAADAVKKSKDKDYVEKLTSFSTAKLLDIVQAAQRRGKAQPAAAAKPELTAEARAKRVSTKAAKMAARTAAKAARKDAGKDAEKAPRKGGAKAATKATKAAAGGKRKSAAADKSP
jgi:hypothetical protein